MTVLATGRDGFTLAELLISLAILGVIATFTIPKILTSQQNAQKLAIFKETLAAIIIANNQGVTNQTLYSDGSNCTSYFLSTLNAVKICPSNSLTQGCWTAAMGTNGEETQPGLTMHNGAYITGFDNNPNETAIVVDWNGPLLPNLIGDDQIKVDVNFGSANPPIAGTGPKIKGSIGPFTGDAASLALYQAIFQ